MTTNWLSDLSRVHALYGIKETTDVKITDNFTTQTEAALHTYPSISVSTEMRSTAYPLFLSRDTIFFFPTKWPAIGPFHRVIFNNVIQCHDVCRYTIQPIAIRSWRAQANGQMRKTGIQPTAVFNNWRSWAIVRERHSKSFLCHGLPKFQTLTHTTQNILFLKQY